MPSEALTRLLNATRPFKTFTVKVGDEDIEFIARRPGAIEAARVSGAYDEAYADCKRHQQEPDYTALYTQLKRQEPQRLVEFIVKADNRDFLQEASYLNNGAALDDLRVIEDAGRIAAEKTLEYNALTHEQLMEKAWERREHFQAVEEGQMASNYMMGVVTLFAKDSDGKHVALFESVDEARSLPVTVLVDVLTEAFKTIGEANDSPLKPAPSQPSDVPTSSPEEKAAESPSPTSSGS